MDMGCWLIACLGCCIGGVSPLYLGGIPFCDYETRKSPYSLLSLHLVCLMSV